MLKVAMVAAAAGLAAWFAQDPPPDPAKINPHAILNRFVGEWECVSEASMGPEHETVKSKGTMSGRMVGTLWAVVEIKGEMDGHAFTGIGTFGYDPNKRKYIGTWIDSMMNHLWLYEGTAEGDKLVLPADGPNPADPTKPTKFRDTWEFRDKDTIILTGEIQSPEGGWKKMMTATCTRKK